eukprot:g1216.t1
MGAKGQGDDVREEEEEDDDNVAEVAKCANEALSVHKRWLSTRQRIRGHVISVASSKNGKRFDAVVTREVVSDFLYNVWYVSDQQTENFVHVDRISSLPDTRDSRLPHLRENDLSEHHALTQRKMWSQSRIKVRETTEYRLALRAALNSTRSVAAFRLALTGLHDEELLEERTYWNSMCAMAGGSKSETKEDAISPFLADSPKSEDGASRSFYDLSVSRRAAVIAALCHFRLDQSSEILTEVRRVEDSNHRSTPLGVDANGRVLWHFPFLRDGHTRVYASSNASTSSWTMLCSDVGGLRRFVAEQKALLSSASKGQRLMKVKRSTRAALQRILDDADAAEAAARKRCSSALSDFPQLKPEFRANMNAKIKRVIERLEDEEETVSSATATTDDAEQIKCALCGFDAFESGPALKCSKSRRCGLTFHLSCMRGCILACRDRGDDNSTEEVDVDAKYDADGLKSPSTWLCPFCRSSRKIGRKYSPEPEPKVWAEGWRKSTRLRSKPKICYRELDDRSALFRDESDESEDAASKASNDDGVDDDDDDDDDDDKWRPDAVLPSSTRSSNRTRGRAAEESISSRWGDVRKSGEYVGWKIAREFNGRIIPATVVGYLEPEDLDDPSLWHVVHADGDEEDLERREVEEGVKLWHMHDELALRDEANKGNAANSGEGVRRRVRFVWSDGSNAAGPLVVRLEGRWGRVAG